MQHLGSPFNRPRTLPCILRLQVDIQFSEAAIREIARVGAYVNKTVENIGARRLHTVLERIVEVSANESRHFFFFPVVRYAYCVDCLPFRVYISFSVAA